MNGDAEARRAHLDVLDGFRGIAILLVLLYHAWLVTGLRLAIPIGGREVGLQFLARTGYLGVDLFFFISGFCLYYPFARATFEGGREPTWRHFAYRRVAKIVPSYVVALAIFAVLYRARFGSLGEETLHLAAHLAFVHVLFPATFGSISGPLWTIGVEVQFYLVFPLLCTVFRARPAPTFVCVIAFAEAFRLIAWATGNADSFNWINQLPGTVDVFVAGMYGAHVVVRTRACEAARVERERLVLALIAATLFACAFVALGAIAAYTGGDPDAERIRAALNAYRVAIGPLLVATVGATILAVGDRRVVPLALRKLSGWSYALYLLNLETLVWVQNAHLPQPAIYALGIATSILFAALFTHVVERPFLATDLRPALRRLLPRKREEGAKMLLRHALYRETGAAREEREAEELRPVP